MTHGQEQGQTTRGELQRKMWRAIRMSRSFTTFDVAMYSGATLDYTKKYISFLLGKGLLKKMGTEGKRALYGPAAALPSTAPARRRKPTLKELQRRRIADWGNAMIRAIRAGDMEKAALAHQVVGRKLQLVLGKK